MFAATGAPVFARPSASKSGAVPFPCQNHPCGCHTSEQGWAGDCCCFTLEEKLAWADARDITPPAHVRPTVAARKRALKSEKSCCAKKAAPSCCDPVTDDAEQPRAAKPVVKWVAGVFAQKCRGEGAGGLLKLELISVPARDAAPHRCADPVDSVREPNARLTSAPYLPPTPPPRNS